MLLVAVTASSSTQGRDTRNIGAVVEECGQFHPDAFDVPVSDERVAAITVFIDPVRFADVVTAVEETDLERAATVVDGLPADDQLHTAFESVTLTDITGEELQTVTPGG